MPRAQDCAAYCRRGGAPAVETAPETPSSRPAAPLRVEPGDPRRLTRQLKPAGPPLVDQMEDARASPDGELDQRLRQVTGIGWAAEFVVDDLDRRPGLAGR